MKVCAHINSGPYQNERHAFNSITEAVQYFRNEIIGNPYLVTEFTEPGADYQSDYSNYGVMDLYPLIDQYSGEQCQCDSACNFHDYPMRRYGIGRRYGLHQVSI